MASLAVPTCPVSWGELLDKISILEIKRARLDRSEALANVAREHRLLHAIAGDVLGSPAIAAVYAALRQVNEALWDIEDAIREEEAAQSFGPRFIALARSVYRRNDERAALKRRINDLLGSDLVEEKSYADWTAKLPEPSRPAAH